MDKELWVVYFESANYCGYGEHCLVWATDSEGAKEAASEYAENYYYEQDTEQYMEDHGYENEEAWASFIKDPYPLSSEEAEDIRGYLLNETQKRFYPIVN